MERQQRLVFATVLYWQSRELPHLERCIESLISQDLGTRDIELTIIVVDNGCGATPKLPNGGRVELKRLPENRGFAGGHNAAMREALNRGADYVFLFNSDAEAAPGVVRELVAAAEANPRAAFVGPVLVSATVPQRIESAGLSFSLRTGRHTELAHGQLLSQFSAVPRRIDALSGCALLARRAALEAIGLLDEDLFFYFEDMDWCLRARRAGFGLVLVPSARVTHIGKGSTAGPSPLATYYSVRNHMLVLMRYSGRIRGAMLAGLAFQYQFAFLARSRPRPMFAHFSAALRGAREAWLMRCAASRSHPNLRWSIGR